MTGKLVAALLLLSSIGCGSTPAGEDGDLVRDGATTADADDGGSTEDSASIIDSGVDGAGTDATSNEGGGSDSGAASEAALDGAGTTAATLRNNRDRLLDTYAARLAKTRCATWSALSTSQKGVFLTITDLLGKRSYLYDAPASGPRAGVLLEQALDHTLVLYAIRGAGSFGNGGGDNNRMFFGADPTLIGMMRSFDSGLPEWGKSSDLGGAHDPFDGTSETVTGQPRGQTQFWTVDSKATPLTRPGVEGVNDPHIYEIDIDYDFFHNSNPAGSYIGGTGSELYEKLWMSRGAGGSAEYDYVPGGC